MGVTGLETAFAVALHRPGAAGRARPRAAGRAHDRRRRALRPAGADARAGRAGEPLPGRPRRPSWTVGEAGYESRSDNSCFAGRELHGPGADDGRGRLRRLPRARLRDPAGDDRGWRPGRQREARPRPRRAGRWSTSRRRSARRCSTSSRSPPTSPCSCRARGSLGLPVLVTEQYPKGLGRTVPEVAEHLDGVEPIEKVCFSARARADGFPARSGRPRPGAAVRHRVPRLRQPDRRGPARGGVEVHVAQDAVTSRTRGEPRARPAQDGALGRRRHERRDRAVRAAARRPARRSSRKSRRLIK